ncbi:MAG: DeoR/GlpR family DNA-binding transcription regulator [Lachnospiraceae bacterium]|nr:DeoR/GlpR family DNA-binding transcription regulator [Lachnospiraceae bacterium]
MKKENELAGLERREKILELLNETPQVFVKELSERFGVSDMTIRRDFHMLEEQGIVNVFYGGASLRNTHPAFKCFEMRQEVLYQCKVEIAKKAVSHIREGDVIYLDTSTTVLLMCRFLPDLHLTVITNSFSVMEELYQRRNIALRMAPGIYVPEYGGSMETATVEYLTRYHYDAIFLGGHAIDPAFGASSGGEVEGILKSNLIKNSDRVYFLADHTKFGRRELLKFADVKDFDAIITDSDVDIDTRNKVLQSGGKME